MVDDKQNLNSLIKMIENFENLYNLDSWVSGHLFTK